MKNPKNPTRNQKEVIRANNLNWKEWLVAEETEFYLKIINKKTGSRKSLDRLRKQAGRRKER